jgi:hypothetical protein
MPDESVFEVDNTGVSRINPRRLEGYRNRSYAVIPFPLNRVAIRPRSEVFVRFVNGSGGDRVEANGGGEDGGVGGVGRGYEEPTEVGSGTRTGLLRGEGTDVGALNADVDWRELGGEKEGRKGRKHTFTDQSFSSILPSGSTPRYFESSHSNTTSASCPREEGEKITVRGERRSAHSACEKQGIQRTFDERLLLSLRPHPATNLSNPADGKGD